MTKDDPTKPAGPGQAQEQIALFSKALELNPYLTPVIYKLAFAYRMSGKPAKQKELLERWRKINPDRPDTVPGPGDSADKVYGEMGKYASVVNPFPGLQVTTDTKLRPLRFEAGKPLEVKLAVGERWVRRSDFTGPKRGDRPGSRTLRCGHGRSSTPTAMAGSTSI